MIITILSDAESWKNAYIPELIHDLKARKHRVRWVHRAADVPLGELAFILGFFQIVPSKVLSRNKHNLVVHESRLPKGRGWSPMTWQVLEGSNRIHLTLFEAVEKVDAGTVYLRGEVPLKGHELLVEIREKTIREMLRLCRTFVKQYPALIARGKPQTGRPTFYARRKASDSRLDPRKSIEKQFNLLRMVDNESYPAFFELKGHTYRLKIEKK
ncbi:MAG: formyltransferase family protein [Elusimicrobiota bacterium]|jgi:methionyl-tRNA formyltransferase